MKISEEEVRHVADLSKLSLSEEGTVEFVTASSRIVDMIELLNGIDTEDVPVATTMTDHKTVMREDAAVAGDDRDEPFKNMPQSENCYIKVPAILENGRDA